MQYQIYFRISRGGIGIPYNLARLEFRRLFERFGLEIAHESIARRRMLIELSLAPTEVGLIALGLGYTEGILHLRTESYQGEALSAVACGRWYLGWVRRRDKKVLQTQVYIQDNEVLRAQAPDRRAFKIERDGVTRVVFGHHNRRAVSVLDVRFLYNIAGPGAVDVILDPFAGYGGIVFEGVRRGLSVFASDLDHSLSPGLEAMAPTRYYVADARSLPVAKDCIDFIITEPPFRSAYRHAVIDSIPEFHRVLKP